MSALDYSYPSATATRDPFTAAMDEQRRQAIQADALLRLKEEADARVAAKAQADEARATAEEARKVQENTVKTQTPLAAVDAMQWLINDPRYQVPYDKAPQEARQHFFNAYEPAVAAQAPKLWNDALRETTGATPAPQGTSLKQVTVGDDGKTSSVYTPTAAEEPQFDEFTTPQEVLAKLPQSEGAMTQQIADYSLPITALGRIPAANKMRILAAAKVLNPDFDVKEFNNLNRARQAYSIGAQGQNIAAINTAIGHLGQLAKLSKQLDNVAVPVIGETINDVKNNIARRSGKSAITSFDQTKEAVASELAKVFKGSGVTGEAQMKEWRKAINSSMSPEQLKEGIANAVHLMGSRVQEIDRQWDQLTKAPRDYRVLSEPNKRILQEIGFDPSELDPTGETPKAASAASLSPAPATPSAATPSTEIKVHNGKRYLVNHQTKQVTPLP